MSIAENVEARKAAEEAISLVSELGAELGLDVSAKVRYWDEIQRLIEEIRGAREASGIHTPLDTMTDEEARRFERSKMKFGKHSGEQIGEVPIGYLLWVHEEFTFERDLARYLKSERGQKAQEGIGG